MLEQRIRKWVGRPPGGLPLYLVGGSVRDLLLGRSVKDIDLTCSRAKDMAIHLSKINNAAMVSMEKDPSAPCYRLVSRKNPDEFVDITQLRGGDILADLAERDFSINAMALPLRQGTMGLLEDDLIDPMSGRRDLENGLIRSLGAKNLQDDPLRILRAFRFAAQLHFTLEPKTLRDCAQLAPGLEKVAFERITAEMAMIFQAEDSFRLVRLLSEFGILDQIFPEIAFMRTCRQDGFHHANVWEHSLETYEACEKVLADLPGAFGPLAPRIRENISGANQVQLIKLATLLHDVGKPFTAHYDEAKGRTTFLGHAQKGEDLARTAVERLRLPKKQQDFVCLLVAEHRHTEQLARPEVKEKTRMAWFRKLGDHCVSCVLLALADNAAKKGALCCEAERTQRAERLKQLVHDYFGRARDILAVPPLITGSDLLALGFSPGPDLGRILKQVLSAQDLGQAATREQALALARGIALDKH